MQSSLAMWHGSLGLLSEPVKLLFTYDTIVRMYVCR